MLKRDYLRSVSREIKEKRKENELRFSISTEI